MNPVKEGVDSSFFLWLQDTENFKMAWYAYREEHNS